MSDGTDREQPDTDEPRLTERNSATVRGEDQLVDKAGTKGGAYGPGGNTADATEEGGDGSGI